ncbi:nuclear division Rft1 protein [Aspergillus unguis]
MSQSSKDARNMLASAALGTTTLVFVQLASRLFVFASNQMVLRSLSPSILGLSAQLELFSISILYFSRESIRAAIQRQPLQPPDGDSPTTGTDAISTETEQEKRTAQAISSQTIVNMCYLSIGMGIATATAFGSFYLHFASEEVSKTPYYHASVAITAVASIIELCSEPMFAVVQQYMLYSKRAVVEVSAAFTKSLVTCAVSLWVMQLSHGFGALPFALGYLSYALMALCGYYSVALHQSSNVHFSLLLSRIDPRPDATYLVDRFSKQLIELSANVFFQSVVKHLLTQGDSMILAAMTSLQDQGIYSLASNYGGLLARILFQPVEESSRAIFSSLLSAKGSKGQKINTEAAKTHLLRTMRGYMVIAVVIIPLGPTLAPRALHILGGRRWTAPEIDALLALYCYYIPFLAFNGIGEAFVSSTANPTELRKQAAWMGLFSICYAVAAYMFLSMGGLGARGLVYANIVNMSVRTIWSFCFVRQFLHKQGSSLALNEFTLRPKTYAIGAAVTILFSGSGLKLDSRHEFLPFMIGVVYVLIVFYCEREQAMAYYDKALQLLRSRNMGSKIQRRKMD